MKNLKYIATAMALALSIAACGDDDAKNNVAANATTNNATTNNATTGNATTNNATTNNATTNNATTNNATTNNNMGGCSALNPAIGPCDPLCQTGCEMDQACVAGSSGPGAPTAAACQPAGTAQEGAACDGTNTCEAGLNCIVTEQGAMQGECAKFCRVGGGDPSCGDGTCVAFDPNVPDLGICRAACQAYPNDTCAMGQQCYPADQMGGTLCGQPGATAAGGACTNLNDCAAGTICFNGTCVSQCAMGGNECGQDENCTTLVGNFAACVASCTTYPNDSCAEGQMCYPTNDGTTACSQFDSTKNVGDACQFANQCNDEQLCIGGACAALCPTAGEATGCGAGEMCVNVQGTTFNVCNAM